MARKVLDYTITTAGRDFGKVFRITELPGAVGDKWAQRLFFALANAGVDIPDSIVKAGMQGVAFAGFESISRLSFEAAEPLLDEMMRCVMIVPDPARPQIVRGLIEDDIEEIMTFTLLRLEVFKLHTGFFQPEPPSQSPPDPATRGAS